MTVLITINDDNNNDEGDDTYTSLTKVFCSQSVWIYTPYELHFLSSMGINPSRRRRCDSELSGATTRESILPRHIRERNWYNTVEGPSAVGCFP